MRMNKSQDGQPLSGATRFGDHADRHDDATQALPVDDSRSDPSTGKAPAQDGDRPRLDVGVIVSPSVKSVTRESVGADLDAELSQRYAQIDWNVVVVADRLEEPPVMPLDLMESARDRMLDEDWDLVLVLTDFPLKDGRRVVKTQLSPVHGVGLVVVPALGATVAAVLADCSSDTRTGSDTVVPEVSVTEAAGVEVVSWTSSVDCETAEVSTADSSGRPPRVSTCLRRASFSWLIRRSSTTISSRKSSTSSWS